MQLLKNSAIYLISGIIRKAIPFLLLPILTNYLSPEDYGKLSIFLVFISIYSAFVGMALHTNIASNFYKVEKSVLAEINGNVIIVLLSSTLIYFIITFFLYIFVDSVFSVSTRLLLFLPVIAFFQTINNLNITILRNEKRALLFGVFEVSLTALIMSITIIALTKYNVGWLSQVVGIAIGALIFGIIGLIFLGKRDYLRFQFKMKHISSILNVSFPLIPHLLGGLIIATSDRLFIENMVSLEKVGVYSVGYSFGMIVMIFTDAFMKAWSPWFYEKMSIGTDLMKKKIVTYSFYYAIALFILAIIISFISKLILPFFVSEEYYGASKFIGWIALGYAIRGIYQIYFPYLVHINRTKFLITCTVAGAATNIILNYILIKEYGVLGAVFATIFSFVVSAFLIGRYQQKQIPMPWFEFRKH